MIEIRCARCRRMLTINDAFAGGVCRCQYCGVIQTVPGRSVPQGPGQPPVRPQSPADAVLRPQPPSEEPRPPETGRPKRPLIWVLLAIALAALVAGWLWYRGIIGANITGESGRWPMLM